MEFTKEQKLYQQIVQKAWEDSVFKEKLVANPAAAIEELTGERLVIPEGKTLVGRDQTTENTVYLNIPTTPEVDVELNEEELESVAGGCQHGPHSGMPTIIRLPEFPDLLFKDIID